VQLPTERVVLISMSCLYSARKATSSDAGADAGADAAPQHAVAKNTAQPKPRNSDRARFAILTPGIDGRAVYPKRKAMELRAQAVICELDKGAEGVAA
jgi:hypothetical protein